MLTIKRIDEEEAQRYLEKEKASHDLVGEQIMGLFTEAGLSGIGSLSLVHDKVYMNFIHVAGDAFALREGLAKALLNMADLRGIKTVYGNNLGLDKLYTALDFKKNNEEFVLSLEHYFSAGDRH